MNDGTRRTITADTIVLGAGSRPELPAVDGLEDARPHTSDTIMRVDELPASLAILGSGVVAAEMAHIVATLGVEVTAIARSGRGLRTAEGSVCTGLAKIR